jgi:VanZ family protein
LKAVQFIPGVVWFIATVILLTLPGNQFPQDPIFKIPQQDKIIHVVFFLGLVYLFAYPFRNSIYSSSDKRSWFLSIAIYAFLYGILIEFIQEYFVPNRSFDVWDIVADTVGCIAGYLYSHRFFVLPKTDEKK